MGVRQEPPRSLSLGLTGAFSENTQAATLSLQGNPGVSRSRQTAVGGSDSHTMGIANSLWPACSHSLPPRKKAAAGVEPSSRRDSVIHFVGAAAPSSLLAPVLDAASWKESHALSMWLYGLLKGQDVHRRPCLLVTEKEAAKGEEHHLEG